jgi:hypothetical protein
MDSSSSRLERFIDDPRVRIAGPVVALMLTAIFLIVGNVAGSSSGYSSKTVSVLPDQPLNIPVMYKSQTVSGADAILAWKQPDSKRVAANAAGSEAAPAGKAKPGKKAKGTLTARR